MKVQNTLLDELRDEHMDELIRLALKYEDALLAEQLANEVPAGALTEAEEQVADRIFQAAWSRATQPKEKPHTRSRNGAGRFLRWAIPIAACIILLVNIALPVAVANSAYFRSKVMELLVCIDKSQNAARFLFDGDEAPLSLTPPEWEGMYYPLYIPGGYSVTQYDTWEGAYFDIEYTNAENSIIRFSERGEDAGGSTGLEGAVISQVTINGSAAMVCRAIATGYTEINWSTNGRWFTLQTIGTEYEESIRIAESVKKIPVE